MPERQFFKRRQSKKRSIVMGKRSRQKKETKTNGFSSLENIYQGNPDKDSIEFVIKCDGEDYSFIIDIPDGGNQETVDKIYMSVSHAITCNEEEFMQVPHILDSINDPIVQEIKAQLLAKFSDIRQKIAGKNCCSPQMQSSVQTLEELHDHLSKFSQPSRQTEKEITMSNNNQNQAHEFAMDIMSEVNKEIEAQLRARGTPEADIEKFMDNMNKTTQAMNEFKTTAEADQAKTAAKNAAEETVDAAKATASAAKETVKETTKAAKAEAKGFFQRHKKKLIIATGTMAAAGLGYWGWKRYGAALLAGGEAAVEAIEVTVEQTAA